MFIAPVVLLGVLAAIVVYVRLLQGPVSLKVLAGPIERGISAELDGITAKVDDAVLQRTSGGDYEFRLINLRLIERDGSIVASAPIAAVALDYTRLATLQLLPRRVDLIEPRLAVTYSEADGIALSFSEPWSTQLSPVAAEGGPREPVVPPRAGPAGGTATPAIPTALRNLDLARLIQQYTARARRRDDATASLSQIGLRNATVDVDYSGNRSQWKVAEISVDLDHRRRRSVISVLARIESDRGPWSLSMLTEDSERTGRVKLTASIRDLVPSALGRAMPELALLRSMDLPVAGNASIEFQTTGELDSAGIAIELGRGILDFGPSVTAPMLIDAGLLNLAYDSGRGQLKVAPSTVKWGESHVTLAGVIKRETPTDAGSGWSFDIRSTDGILGAEEFGVSPVPLEALTVSGRIEAGRGLIELTNIDVRAGGVEIVLAGDVVAGSGAEAGVRLDGRFGSGTADVAKVLWPRMLAPRARDWIGEHVRSAMIRGGKFSFASGSFAGPDAVLVKGIIRESSSLEVTAEGVDFVPFKDSPPIRAPQVLVRGKNQDVDVTIPSAVLLTSGNNGVNLKGGLFTVKRIDDPLPVADVTFSAQAALAPAVEALRQLRVAGADNLDLPTDVIQGKFSGDFRIKMPLSQEVEPETIAIQGKAKITEVKSKEKIGAISVQSGSVDVEMGETKTVARGELILNGVLAKLNWSREMGPAAASAPPLTITALLDNADRRQLGIDVNDYVNGDVPVTVTFETDEQGGSVKRVRADLTPAEVSIGELAWTKARGSKSQLQFDIVEGSRHKTELQNFRITGDRIAAEGWIGLSADNKVQEFSFPTFSLNLVSRLQLEGKRGSRDVWNVKARGTTFDGRDFFRSLFSVGRDTAPKRAQKTTGGIDLTASIDNVLGHSDVALRGFSMRLSQRGGELTALDARGTLDGGRPLAAVLQSQPGAGRKIFADSTDAGQALRLIGFYENMQGGRVRLEVDLEGRGAAEQSGTLWIDSFKVLGDPIVSEVFSGVEGDGPAIGAATPGRRRVVREVFEFDRMKLPFSVGHGQFAIEESYIRGPVLGATLRGKVDYGAQRVNIGGTYVPLQGLNNMLGGIPVLGQIISGPRGEGIFGITFAIQGPMSNPQVIVNPLSLVAPGIFREIFQMTNPSTAVQPREQSPAAPADRRVRASSSGGPYEAPQTVDGWSSDTVVPTKRN